MSKTLGVAQSIGPVTAATAYTAHAAGATPVTSNAATDLDTTAAQVAILTTKVNELITKMSAVGLIDS